MLLVIDDPGHFEESRPYSLTKMPRVHTPVVTE